MKPLLKNSRLFNKAFSDNWFQVVFFFFRLQTSSFTNSIEGLWHILFKIFKRCLCFSWKLLRTHNRKSGISIRHNAEWNKINYWIEKKKKSSMAQLPRPHVFKSAGWVKRRETPCFSLFNKHLPFYAISCFLFF